LHNFYLARLTREVKREINIRNAARRDARGARHTLMRAKRWKKAKTVIGVMSKMGGGGGGWPDEEPGDGDSD